MQALKIYKAFPSYKEYLDHMYSKIPELRYASFEGQKQILKDDGFPWIFSWTSNIKDDFVSIFETVHNCEWLQKAWNNHYSNASNWQINIVLDQIQKVQPNICALYPPEFFDRDVIADIRNIVKHDVLILGYDGMHRKREDLYENYDIVLTCSDYISDYYRDKNITAYSLQFGFDESLLNKIDTNRKPIYKIGFTGSIYPKLHNERYEFLKYLTRQIHVSIRSDFGNSQNFRPFSKSQLKRLIVERDFQGFWDLWRIEKMNKGPVFGLEMYQFLRDSKISLNIHGDEIKFAANVRLFETTGVGSCLLTDWKENISDIFIPDVEVVTYNSYDEALDKLKFLLKNESIRNKIAIAGQNKTLKYYTYKKRLKSFLSFLKINFFS